jgi:hypothetical protein
MIVVQCGIVYNRRAVGFLWRLHVRRIDKAGQKDAPMTSSLRDFLEVPYDELEELNLQMKALRLARTLVDILREERSR